MGEDEKPEIIDDEEEGKEGQAEAAPASSDTSKIIKILLYVVGFVLLIFIVFGISYLVSSYVQEKRYEKEQDIVVAPPPAPLTNFDLPPFSVTTKDPEPHFAKLAITLGFKENPELNAELIKRTPQIQHIINILLRGKRFEDLDSVEDSINLAEEIKAHINVILSSGKILEVFFKEFIVN